MTDRMQFTDLGSYQRIWRWMGECGDTHQQAGEVIFSTPNMHWPGQVARPGDWIVRTPTGFVAEPARPECICPDDPTDLEGPRCPVHEVEQLKADLSAHMDAAKVREAALAESRGEVERLREKLERIVGTFDSLRLTGDAASDIKDALGAAGVALKAERIDSIPSHKSPPDDGVTYLQIDRLNYRVSVGEYTGSGVRRFAHPPIAADRDLWLLVPGEDDHLIHDDDTVAIRNSGLRFFTTPRFINAGSREGSP